MEAFINHLLNWLKQLIWHQLLKSRSTSKWSEHITDEVRPGKGKRGCTIKRMLAGQKKHCGTDTVGGTFIYTASGSAREGGCVYPAETNMALLTPHKRTPD